MLLCCPGVSISMWAIGWENVPVGVFFSKFLNEQKRKFFFKLQTKLLILKFWKTSNRDIFLADGSLLIFLVSSLGSHKKKKSKKHKWVWLGRAKFHHPGCRLAMPLLELNCVFLSLAILSKSWKQGHCAHCICFLVYVIHCPIVFRSWHIAMHWCNQHHP